ncbi:MAG: hypothetical protein KC563_01680 [Nitrospira sp.]|nr:hypothetical protein [Nitrospira sp.]MCA9474511.1 hypothetical protein [Nitrospira sp.]MCA9480604.1 hypothetical protein [Nitrospira sp.]MCB9711489.1 hypothetical protein [Nitrospiraceae bacterium]MDR4488640.1 hypothetical protein [Nitrospirales bacterium]
MPKNIVVLIREDPQKSHRASEAIRIALGLSTGPNPLKIILIGHAKYLVTEEAYDLPDGEMLEKYLPVIQNLNIPVLLDREFQEKMSYDSEFSLQKLSNVEMAGIVADADRVLVF